MAIDVAQRDHLYRIAQEALSIALRHAHAKRASLQLNVDAERVCVSVEDDGCGLSAASQAGGGLGMHTMRYRAGAAGGRLVVAAGATGGTCITPSCPNRPWAINAVRDPR
jgi:signal transduction histidine kinase